MKYSCKESSWKFGLLAFYPWVELHTWCHQYLSIPFLPHQCLFLNRKFCVHWILYLFLKCLFIYFERDGNRDIERRKERIPSRPYTVSTEPDAGFEPTNCEIMAWAETKSRMLNLLSYPGIPLGTMSHPTLSSFYLSTDWLVYFSHQLNNPLPEFLKCS